ncbi:MAG TPA: DUF1566 domain-containing protein [Polyangia bacterium]|nr:DUF1566 domain-containing protein [Polyangia bacterium]
MTPPCLRFIALASLVVLGACGSSGGGSGGSGATGGSSASGTGGTGGTTGAGGGTSTGGVTGTGGGTSTGGASATGGTSGTGGVLGSGGVLGAAGAKGSGGTTGTGGAAGRGGTTGSGGAAGATGKGGATGSGGVGNTGGATGTGGATTADGGAACSDQPPSEYIYARWPMPNPASSGLPNPASYTDNGDGTVTDNVTKLVWQKAVTSSQAYSWCNAINYCATLTLAGRTWRLPTRIELLSLVDFTRTGPAINTTSFPGVPGGKYHWTSSPWVVSQIATKPQYSWIVNFSEGLTSNAGDRTAAEYARCVSAPDEGALPSPRYVSVATGEVQDVDTKLVWATAATTTTTDFATAQTTCSGLGLNGHTWRTPSIKELATLVDEVPPISKVSPAIDTTTFAGTAATTPYWSSSLYGGMSATAHDPWVINYEDGFTEYNQTAALVRCVR